MDGLNGDHDQRIIGIDSEIVKLDVDVSETPFIDIFNNGEPVVWVNHFIANF